MMRFNGPVLFLDRSDINTDEIIPARYLTEISKEALRPHLLEDLSLEEFDPRADIAGKRVIVTRSNFGCGSSREHAPWALEVNGITVVVARSFARIFRQNMFNCGMLAIELPKKDIDSLFALGDKVTIAVDIDQETVITKVATEVCCKFTLNSFDKALVQAGGWLAYADKKY
ncbi:MAG: 3-isopropylmalate dehydratase small subunit [Deltaproteobacteria bacterium]|nr:3-isopropylmalate dehydratase small subunit [Deltaproteobacteria bacterium]